LGFKLCEPICSFAGSSAEFDEGGTDAAVEFARLNCRFERLVRPAMLTECPPLEAV